MSSFPSLSWLRRAATAFVLSFVVLATGRALPERHFKTSQALAAEVSTMAELLERVNFNHEAVNSEPKPKVGDDLIHAYMGDLDSQRLFFLATDEQAYNRRYANALYYNLQTLGQLDCAFDIYSLYEKRVESRVNWIFAELQKNFDFTSHEMYPLDRSKAPWPATQAEADDLWRRRLKFELLQDLLDKKTLDQAKQSVHRRYERLLKNLADMDTSDITEMFLNCLAGLYDPHSTYFSPEDYEDFSIQMRLSLVGIGALLGVEDNQCVVKEIIPGGPADLSKQIHPNDKIIAVANEGEESVDIIGMKLRKIVDLIRGQKGTKVKLTIVPGNVAEGTVHKEITIVRDVVKLNSARARAAIYTVPEADGKAVPIGVITLPSFYGLSGDDDDQAGHSSASKDVAELITRLKAAGIKGLVLDLRRNGGGLLSEAINLTGLFINQGPVVQVKNFNGEVQVDSDDDPGVSYAGPLAVLVSRFSASASEIVAGALQDYGRAVIVGDSSTHGKGTVQAIWEMKNTNPMLALLPVKTGAAKLTIQKFYLPNGSSTQNKGVVPDIVLPSIDDYMKIGESDLPHALAWDEIPSAAFNGHLLDRQLVTLLRNDSEARQQHLEEFAYLRKGITWFKQKQDQKEISLNLAQREQQKQADDAFKKSMEAEKAKLAKTDYPYQEFTLVPTPKKKPALKKKSEDGNGQNDNFLEPDEDEEDPGVTKVDVDLRESLRVLCDVLNVSHDPKYWVNGSAPLTVKVSKND